MREWIAERIPEPLQQLKERSRDLFDAVAQKARGARGPERGKAPSRGAGVHPEEPRAPPGSGRSLDAAERARILKEATALERQALDRQVQAVRDEQAARPRLDELVRQERERQRVQQLELEQRQKLELEKVKALERRRDRGLER